MGEDDNEPDDDDQADDEDAWRKVVVMVTSTW